ncbi:MAG: 2-C-methyl-D-erythritol 2,4-cyclodiphosphate synthase [Dehalococcoidia bacterium]|nr:2-C-methyl-D-erythritol 2,4-cyclodiphosphate synthase [Dehalococcoidia bacterium]
MTTRFGIGYDAHQLVQGEDFYLAGVKIPFEKGPKGHSDGDVLAHAIIDALLGAAGLGDIGMHFSESSSSVPKGISSMELLNRSLRMLHDSGWRVVNVDATIALQLPKLQPFFNAMRIAIAESIFIDVSQVNIKATTEDGLGYTGSGDGIFSIAIAAITDEKC